MKLTEHFTLDEFTLSQTAERNGLDNSAPPNIVKNLSRVASVLEMIRVCLHVKSGVDKPIMISSGYRAPAVNKAVGGARDSAHMKGLAADINVPGMAPKELALMVARMGLPIDQVILEFDRWVHIGLSEEAPRYQLLTIRTGTGYMTGIV